jgi:cytochrome c oxidase subunit 2
LFGKRVTFADGTTRVADEDYIRESILRPHVQITPGYEETMPIYQDQLSEADVLNLIAFIEGDGTTAVAPSSPMNQAGVGLNGAHGGVNPSATVPESPNPMAVGAIRYENPVAEATPTNRKKNPAVGAIAAEGKR